MTRPGTWRDPAFSKEAESRLITAISVLASGQCHLVDRPDQLPHEGLARRILSGDAEAMDFRSETSPHPMKYSRSGKNIRSLATLVTVLSAAVIIANTFTIRTLANRSEQLQQTIIIRFVPGLQRIDQNKKATGSDHPSQFRDDCLPDFRRQFVEEVYCSGNIQSSFCNGSR